MERGPRRKGKRGELGARGLNGWNKHTDRQGRGWVTKGGRNRGPHHLCASHLDTICMNSSKVMELLLMPASLNISVTCTRTRKGHWVERRKMRERGGVGTNKKKDTHFSGRHLVANVLKNVAQVRCGGVPFLGRIQMGEGLQGLVCQKGTPRKRSTQRGEKKRDNK